MAFQRVFSAAILAGMLTITAMLMMESSRRVDEIPPWELIAMVGTAMLTSILAAFLVAEMYFLQAMFDSVRRLLR